MTSEAHITESHSGKVFALIWILGCNTILGKDPSGNFFLKWIDREDSHEKPHCIT